MFTNFSAAVRQTLVTDRQRSLTAATGRVGSARGEKGSLHLMVALALAMALALAVASKAEASAGTTQVSGLLTPDGAGRCPGGSTAVGAYVVSGSMTGCWYVDSMTVDHLNDNGGGFIATGREHFVGCLGSRCGQLRTTYTFTAKFAPDGSEIHGRCHHPVVGGDGGFAGVTGAFEMHDLPNGCAAYHGTLKF